MPNGLVLQRHDVAIIPLQTFLNVNIKSYSLQFTLGLFKYQLQESNQRSVSDRVKQSYNNWVVWMLSSNVSCWNI